MTSNMIKKKTEKKQWSQKKTKIDTYIEVVDDYLDWSHFNANSFNNGSKIKQSVVCRKCPGKMNPFDWLKHYTDF